MKDGSNRTRRGWRRGSTTATRKNDGESRAAATDIAERVSDASRFARTPRRHSLGRSFTQKIAAACRSRSNPFRRGLRKLSVAWPGNIRELESFIAACDLTAARRSTSDQERHKAGTPGGQARAKPERDEISASKAQGARGAPTERDAWINRPRRTHEEIRIETAQMSRQKRPNRPCGLRTQSRKRHRG